MSRRGRSPRRRPWRLALGALGAAVLLTACDAASTATTTTVTLVPVTGGRTTVGIDQAPTGCNPNTTTGNTWATRLVLAPVLPSAFVVDDNGNSVGNQALATSAELVSTKPQTIVYTLNPKAVWSDGVPITAADFIFAWDEQRGARPTPTSPWTRPPRALATGT